MAEDENNDYLQTGPAPRDAADDGSNAAEDAANVDANVNAAANAEMQNAFSADVPEPDAMSLDGSDAEATQAYNPFEFIDEMPAVPPAPPVQPAQPAQSAQPVQSVQHVQSIPPAQPVQQIPPTQPAVPDTQPVAESFQPAASIQPAQQTQPVQQPQPVQPVQSTQPVQPTQPMQSSPVEETQAFTPDFAQPQSFAEPQPFAQTQAFAQPQSFEPQPQQTMPQQTVPQPLIPESLEQTQAFDPFADEAAYAAVAAPATQDMPAQQPTQVPAAQSGIAQPGVAQSGIAEPGTADAGVSDASQAPEATGIAEGTEAAYSSDDSSEASSAASSDTAGAPNIADEWNAIMNEPEAASGIVLPDEQSSQRKRVATWAVVLAIVVVVLLGGILFLHFHYADRVAPGVTLGGTDMGGMTASQARSQVQTIAGQTTVSVTGSDTTVVATLNDLGVTVDADKTVNDLINTKPANSFGGFFQRFNPFARRTASLDASTDESTMLTYLTDSMIDEDQRLENATVSYNKDLSRYTSTEGKDGKTVDLAPVKDAVQQALADPGSVHSATTTVTDGKATVTTQTATDACDQANQRLSNPIVLRTDGGTSLTIPVSTIASWITLTTDLDQGTITMDYDSSAIDQYATGSISDALNRAATDEIIVKDNSGNQLGTLQSGKKGVQVNDTSTVGSQILSLLQGGTGGKITVGAQITDYTTQTQTRNLTGENGDMWVQVDLTQQTLTVSNGSTEVKKIDISTGTAGSVTAAGTYFVWSRAESGPVVGEDTGSNNPQWVTYYNGDVAILGADWDQDSITKGLPSTHGCIYMSSADAKWIYDNVKDSVVVVVSGGTPGQAVRNDDDKDTDKDENADNGDNKDSDSQQPQDSQSSQSNSSSSPSASPSASASPSSSSSASPSSSSAKSSH